MALKTEYDVNPNSCLILSPTMFPIFTKFHPDVVYDWIHSFNIFFILVWGSFETDLNESIISISLLFFSCFAYFATKNDIFEV